MVDGGDGSTLDGGLDGGLGLEGEGADLGEGGRLDDASDSGEDGGGVEGGKVARANEFEQVGDEDDLETGESEDQLPFVMDAARVSRNSRFDAGRRFLAQQEHG